MNKTFALSLFAACVSFAMIGCGAPGDEALDEDERLGTAEQALVAEDPPEGLNHFGARPFWAGDTQAAYRIMGAGPLNRKNGLLPDVTIRMAYRVQVLRNAIECGLGQDQSVIDPETGVTLFGHWGLARSWMDEALTTSQRRYVTACMAQRLNAHEMPIPILLKGRNEEIRTDSDLDLEYPFDESTAWGDLFSSAGPLDDDDDPPFELFVCSDSDLHDFCHTIPAVPDDRLRYRICDSSPYCGLNLRGPCSNPAVCTTSSTGYPVCDGVIETVHVQLAAGVCSPAP